MIFKKIVLVSLAVSSLVSATSALAGAAWDFNTVTPTFTNGSWDFGINFQVNKNVTVTGLGYLAPTGNPVALYNSVGNLLASANVIASDPLIGNNFQFASVTPVTLLAGQTYQVDGASLAVPYVWSAGSGGVVTGLTTDPAITILGSVYNAGNQALFNSSGYVDGPYYGPNVLLSVPEPESYAMLLAGLGLMGFMVRRKKSA
jgi:hypothetical protein